jgi:hypothetical protein
MAGKKSEKPQADWSEEMIVTLLQVLLDEVRLGKRADTGFKSTSYERALVEVNKRVDGRGNPPNLELGQVKTKVNAVSLPRLQVFLRHRTRRCCADCAFCS